MTLTDRTGERSLTGKSDPPPPWRFLIVAGVCLVLGGLVGLLVAGLKESDSPEPAPVRFTPPEVPARDFRLRDQNGKWTTLAAARGNVVVLTWLYSSCRDLCPAQAKIIVDAVGRVGGTGVQVYGVSVDPVGDTPKRVQAWLKIRGLDAAPFVHFLIGTRAELAPVWRAFAIAPVNASPQEMEAAAETADAFRAQAAKQAQQGGGAPKQRGRYTHPRRATQPEAYEPYPDARDLRYRGRSRHIAGLDFEHSAYVMLIDKHGNQRVGLPFEQLDAAGLARDIRLLRAES
jgi:protein SCO1/2